MAAECSTAREHRQIQDLLQKLKHISSFFPSIICSWHPLSIQVVPSVNHVTSMISRRRLKGLNHFKRRIILILEGDHLQRAVVLYPSDFTVRVMAMISGVAMQTFSLANSQSVSSLTLCLAPVRHLPALPLLSYVLTFDMLLRFHNVVPWEYLKRVDGHQIQSKRFSALLREEVDGSILLPLPPTKLSTKHNCMQHLTTELINYALLE